MQNLDPANETKNSENIDSVADFFAKEKNDEEDNLENLEAEVTSPKTKRSFPPLKKWQKVLLIVLFFLAIIFGAVGVVGYYTYQVSMDLRNKATEGEFIARSAYDAFKAQNLPESENQLKILQEKLVEIDQTYQKLAFYNNVPFVNQYYQDGKHGLKTAEHGLNAGLKAISTIAPYADVLGFEGEGTFTGGTAEDRIKVLIETLDAVMPAFDDLIAEISLAEEEFSKIDPDRYPEEFRGIVVKPRLIQAQEMMDASISAFKEFRPVIEQLPDIAGGKDERRKYLVLFQNDNELRPTGGFLTAYAVIYMENGKVTPEKSDDIYELDKKFTKRLPIPEALGRYLTTERYWNLRDMNTSPDFKISMSQFFENYQGIRGEPDNIDGIIAVDTHTLKGLLEVLGPVEIPGYGTFSAENDPRCDCPQVVYALSEIITKPTPYLREDRKGILGPMMQAILTKTYTANKQQWPALFELAWKNLEQRHVQLYFLKDE